MPSMPLRRLVLAALLGALATLAALPAAALAALVYNTQPSRGQPALYAAANDGSQRVKLATGYYSPTISPDGTMVAALRQTRSGNNRLYVLPIAGGAPTLLLGNVGPQTVAWSPDSQSLAAVTGRRLVLISLAEGVVETLATGAFNGTSVSFSPAGDAIAYSRATSSRLNAPSDVYTVTIVGGAITRLTTDGLSSNPVWGPTQIAYSKGPKRRRDFPKLNIWLMNPDGSGQSQLTSVRVRSLVAGLEPLQWSASGAELVANYSGQDTLQAYAVNPLTGSASDLGAMPLDGTAAFAISRDGTTVLAQTGGVEGPSPGQAVVAIPFGGGTPTTLVRRGINPDWNA
jgi:Tol biopolymer transport system component